MITALSIAVLLSPIAFAALISSSLSLRKKTIIGAAVIGLLIVLPLLAFWLGPA